MKRHTATLGMLAVFAVAPASADTGFYLGGSLGSASYDGTVPGTSFSIDDDDTASKLYGGFRVLSLLAVEGGYVDFGEMSSTAGSMELSGWDLFGVGNLPVGPVNLFAKLGGIAWESDFSGAISSDQKGHDLAYGVGVAFRMGSFDIRSEYEIFETDNDDIDMFSVGAEYNF